MSPSTSADPSAISTVRRYASGPADATMSTGLVRSLRRQKRDEAGASLFRKLRDLQPCRLAGVGGQDAGTARVGHDRDAAPSRQRLAQAGGQVEHLVDRIGPNDAGLSKQRVHGNVARRQRRRVTARGAPARLRRPALRATIGLVRAIRRRSGRTAAGCRTTRGTAGSRSSPGRLPVLEQVVAGDVGLVADADERREAEPALRRRAEDGEAERRRSATRAPTRPGGGNTGENDAFSRTAGSAFSRPMQFGRPSASRSRGPCSTSCSCSARPASPTSANPAVIRPAT